MVVCLEILVCAAGSSKVDAFTAHASERARMKSKRREKIFPPFRPTGGCVSLGAAQLYFETSFRRFRRTRLEGRVSLPRGASSLGLLSRVRRHEGHVRCLASITVSDWRRQTQLRARPCRLNRKCVSLRYDVGRGSPHSRLPDLSAGTQVQHQVIQRRTNPTCEALLQ